MKRAFEKGFLPVDFAAEPFGSPAGVLWRSASVYFRDFWFIAAATLVVFLPAKAAIQLVCAILDVSTKGLAMYLLLDASDLVLASLVTPAVIYRLMSRFRGKPPAALAESLRWGRRQWGRTLWNKVKVEITVMLWAVMLVIPGLVVMIKLMFTDQVVAIEGDRTTDPLDRSRDIVRGHGWRILLVALPVWAVELVGAYYILGTFHGSEYSRVLLAVVDSLLSVGGQWANVVVLVLYLGLVPKEAKR